MIQPHDGMNTLLHSSSTNESKKYVKLKKPAAKEHIQYDSIYRKFENMQKAKMYIWGYIVYSKAIKKSKRIISTKFRIVVTIF